MWRLLDGFPIQDLQGTIIVLGGQMYKIADCHYSKNVNIAVYHSEMTSRFLVIQEPAGLILSAHDIGSDPETAKKRAVKDMNSYASADCLCN